MSTMQAMLQQLDQQRDTAAPTPRAAACGTGPAACGPAPAAAKPGRRKRARKAGTVAGKAGRKTGAASFAPAAQDVMLTLPQGGADGAGPVPAPAFAIRLPAHWVAPGTQLGIDPRCRPNGAGGSAGTVIDITPVPVTDPSEWSRRWALGCVQRSRLHKGRKLALAVALTATIPLAWATNWLGLLPAPAPDLATPHAALPEPPADATGEAAMAGFSALPADAGRPFVLGLDSMTGPLIFAPPSLGRLELTSSPATTTAAKRSKAEAATADAKPPASAVRPAGAVAAAAAALPLPAAAAASSALPALAVPTAVVTAAPAAVPEAPPAQIERKPRSEPDPLQKVGELMAVGRRGEAIQALQTVLQRQPTNAPAHRALLSLLDERGRGEDWLQALQDSARALPLQFGVLAAKGLAEAGQTQQALDLLLTLPEPAQDLAYWSARGALHRQLDQHEAAQAALAQALTLVPPGAARASSLQLARAASLQALGRPEQAREAWLQVLALHSAPAEAREHAMRQLQVLGTRTE